MFKPMTLSLSVILGLAATSTSMAGGDWPHASSQSMPSPQIVSASPQSIGCGNACPTVMPSCAPKKFCFTLPKLPKIQCPKFRLEKYTVTKTKFRLVKCAPAPSCNSCGACDSCMGAPVSSWPTSYPSAQSAWGSSQAMPSYGAPQSYSAPQSYGAPQSYSAPQSYGAPISTGSGQAGISTSGPSMYNSAPIQSSPAMAPQTGPGAPPEAPHDAPKADDNAKTSGALILDPVNVNR